MLEDQCKDLGVNIEINYRNKIEKFYLLDVERVFQVLINLLMLSINAFKRNSAIKFSYTAD